MRPSPNKHSAALQDIFNRLYQRYGPQRWWPAETPFEVMVGAVLTQSTAWSNVEKAIANLKSAGMLSPEAIRSLSHERLAQLIRPSGYFNAKAVKLKALVRWIGDPYHDSLDSMRQASAAVLRRQLLHVHGVGHETADSILLYAVGNPTFVIDAYTRRIMRRVGLGPRRDDYEAWRELFEKALPGDVRMFNEYHALFVQLGKETCTNRRPSCPECCLRDVCRTGRLVIASARAVAEHRGINHRSWIRQAHH